MRKEFFNQKNVKLDLYLVNCGIEDCCANFVCAPHIRKYYLIHYVTKGSGYFEVNGEKHRVFQNDIFVIHPNQVVTYYSPDIDNTWSFCWMGFSGEKAGEYFSLTGVDSFVYNLRSQGFYSNILNCINYFEENKDNLSQLKLNSFVLEGLHHLSCAKEKQRNKTTEYIDKATRYIEYNYMNGISAKDVSGYLSIDRTYFYRIFKTHTGTSPEQYIMKYRIKRAAELLKCSSFTIGEIATFVGFRDTYYFSRLFKKITGINPSEYRKKK